MNKIIEDLNKWGCNTQEGIGRVLDDDEFYVDCLKDLTDDENFKKLETAVKEKDVSSAFQYAHALKGVIANLSLTPMYNKIVEIVEPLRRGEIDGVSENVEKLLEMKKHIDEILA